MNKGDDNPPLLDEFGREIEPKYTDPKYIGKRLETFVEDRNEMMTYPHRLCWEYRDLLTTTRQIINVKGELPECKNSPFGEIANNPLNGLTKSQILEAGEMVYRICFLDNDPERVDFDLQKLAIVAEKLQGKVENT